MSVIFRLVFGGAIAVLAIGLMGTFLRWGFESGLSLVDLRTAKRFVAVPLLVDILWGIAFFTCLGLDSLSIECAMGLNGVVWGAYIAFEVFRLDVLLDTKPFVRLYAYAHPDWHDALQESYLSTGWLFWVTLAVTFLPWLILGAFLLAK